MVVRSTKVTRKPARMIKKPAKLCRISAAGKASSAMKLVSLGEGRERRFPNIVVSKKGTLLACWGRKSVSVRRSADRGQTWGPAVSISAGIHGGGMIVDDNTSAILLFVETHHPPAKKLVFKSVDDGRSWHEVDAIFHPDSRGNIPDLHMNEHGLTLHKGTHAGRLLRATRQYAGENYGPGNSKDNWPNHYASVIYSDDGGVTWHSSEPVPGHGFGEAAVVELADGSLYMNLRRHWAPPKVQRKKRWSSTSTDGGMTWSTPVPISALPDGPRNSTYGLMGGLAATNGCLIFSNVDSNEGRCHGHVWASFDEGKTWPIKREVCPSRFAYSALAAKGESIYLVFEGDTMTFVRIELDWLRRGSSTGDADS